MARDVEGVKVVSLGYCHVLNAKSSWTIPYFQSTRLSRVELLSLIESRYCPSGLNRRSMVVGYEP